MVNIWEERKYTELKKSAHRRGRNKQAQSRVNEIYKQMEQSQLSMASQVPSPGKTLVLGFSLVRFELFPLIFLINLLCGPSLQFFPVTLT